MPSYRNRIAILSPVYRRVCRRIGIATAFGAEMERSSPELRSPHPLLRRTLQQDPAMAALLPSVAGYIALGSSADVPFFLRDSGILRLPPALLEDAPALAAAARWGLEALSLQATGIWSQGKLAAVLRHGAALLAMLPRASLDLLLDQLPAHMGARLLSLGTRIPDSELVAWQASRIEAATASGAKHGPPRPQSELELPVEAMMVAGGDSRLEIDPRTGFNRYGTTPRPRPEAVHFSSSTASSISDYGFMYCDLMRRDLLRACRSEEGWLESARANAIDAIAAEILGLLGIDEHSADVAIASSGTDTELLAVMIALGAGDQPLTNLLISSREGGRGVALAASGKYFDDVAATGAAVRKGEPVWPDADIRIVDTDIRSASGAPLTKGDIDEQVMNLANVALSSGHRVLLHVLATSKTGLSAPSVDCVESLGAAAPRGVDVVVDACQMRVPMPKIADWVRRGWMVQISGSKFFTGPPFSGALIVPLHLRARATKVATLLARAPGLGHGGDWTEWWRARLPAHASLPKPSFGPIMRWLPAIMEAHLFDAVPFEVRRDAFEQFRSALRGRLARSSNLVALQSPDLDGSADSTDFASRTIVCFTVLVNESDGHQRRLDEVGCQTIFGMLNVDMSERLGCLTASEIVQARQMAHIGQAVRLGSGSDGEEIAVLRLVLGARFFTIVGHAGPGAVQAALESEISDAERAIEKLELIASRWWKVKKGA